MMKSLIITQRSGRKFEVLLDNEDYKKVKQHKWFLHDKRGYVSGKVGEENILLHRFIMKPPINMLVDHINHNPLDNQKSNLRVCTKSQNCAWKNMKLATLYRGIAKSYHGWTAGITRDQKRFYLGYYKTPEQATHAYNEAAIRLFGEFAVLNEITVYQCKT